MATEVLRLKVTLQDSEPEIWRQVEVPSTNTLAQLYRVLQVAMGWTDSHLHQYWQGDRCFGMADPELGLEGEDERKVRLNTLFRQPGDPLVYEYDFGDGWEQDIVQAGRVQCRGGKSGTPESEPQANERITQMEPAPSLTIAASGAAHLSCWAPYSTRLPDEPSMPDRRQQ